ncbi:hypothetical protein [Streptomyces sp. NBC_01198]|nr:hypothetical protein OG702_19660 [Streptomyces sp. NBC_01198]
MINVRLRLEPEDPLRVSANREEVAGFVIALAFAGADPNSAVPHVPTSA